MCNNDLAEFENLLHLINIDLDIFLKSDDALSLLISEKVNFVLQCEPI